MSKDSEFMKAMAREWFAWDGEENNCRTCNKTATEFRDDISRREFEISGLCQDCQDEVFDEE